VTCIYKDFLEAIFFFILTVLLYSLFIFTFPVFRDPHGWVVMNDFPGLSKNFLVQGLLFGSACVCVFLGTVLMAWAPNLTPGMMSNLWATTYFFVWIDSVLTLSIQFQTFKYLTALGIGLAFIYFLFFILHYLGGCNRTSDVVPQWKRNSVHYWIWGWIVVYFVLSCLLTYRSFYDIGFQLPLAWGTLIVCLINYLLYVFLEKSEGKNVENLSRFGRIIFTLWIAVLLFVWISRRWAV
jgi:hypothetical protein